MRDVLVVAEIGVNANGSVETAKQMIRAAKDCGCDAVKFQKRTIDIVYTEEFLDSPRESPWGTTQRAQKEALEFGFDEYAQINEFCKVLGIPWFASAWDVGAFNFLKQFDLPYHKVASPMLKHKELLGMIAAEKKPTFVSCGMSDWDTIDTAVATFRLYECPFTLMHCVSEYPCPEERLNLRMIQLLQARYGCPVGYSGHEVSPWPSLVAATLGATVIERHFTLDRTAYGSDNPASLEPHGMEMLVKAIRGLPAMLGDGQRRLTEAEVANAMKLRWYEQASR
jgi:N-acetylneuraminate synthase